VGESGCGKSTLGRTLVGLYDKTSGEVLFEGKKMPERFGPREFRQYSRQIQMIFQDPYSSLNPRMTVRDIISEGPRLHRLWDPSELDTRAGDWLERVGLSRDHLSRYPHEFSGGQRQRISIARALALEPRFVVCDEPISALDVSVQAQVINLLAELKEKLGLTLLFIAHDLSMVRYVSDRMAVMYLGSVVELGPSDEVFFKPVHPYTQLLIGSAVHALERPELSDLKKEIPTPVNIGPGCRFARRCPMAQARCTTETPALREIRSAHFAACHLV
jgi:oligopeptide/dipeptide ABC transporter ATP-binding protein